MKAAKYSLIILTCFLFSCQKNNTTSTPTSSISASINGSNINFTSSFSNNNGLMVIQGTSNTYTISIYIQISGPGIQYFQTSPSYPYATVTNISGSYSTVSANENQITITTGSSAGLYNGTFSFTAAGSAGTLTVSGQFSNM